MAIAHRSTALVISTFVTLVFRAACAASATSTAAVKAACDDDFSGTALGAAWTFFDADGETGGSARVSAGRLELNGRGSDVFQAVNEFVGVKRAAQEGDWDVSVRIESQSGTHDWAQAGILAAADAEDPSRGGYVVVDVTPGNGYHVFYDESGSVGTLDRHVDVGVTAYPVRLRLARKGNRFSAWYRHDAEPDWTPIAANIATQGTAAASQIVLFSLSHNDAAAGTTVFDEFSCTGSSVVGIRIGGRAGGMGALSSGGPGAAVFTRDAVGRIRNRAGHAEYTVLTFTNSRIPKWESSRP